MKSTITTTDGEKQVVDTTHPLARCGECAACQCIVATRKIILADSYPAGPGLTNSHAQLWNQILVDNPCPYRKVRISHNNIVEDARLLDRPADLYDYELRVETRHRVLTIHKDNVAEWEPIHPCERPIAALTGETPHPTQGNWFDFLQASELRYEVDGVRYFGRTNCNYILFPCGTLIQNYGYHGKALMNAIRTEGREPVLARLKRFRDEVTKILHGK